MFVCNFIDFCAFLQTSSQILSQSASTRIIYVLCILSFCLSRPNIVLQICISWLKTAPPLHKDVITHQKK